MNKAVVFLSGVIDDYTKLKKLINDKFDIYCADGGAEHTKILNLIPKLILGDFDSIKTSTKDYYLEKTKFKEYSRDKDFTDGELIIKEIYDSYEEILIYGGFGGDHHHLLANIFLLEKYPKIKLLNDYEEMFYVDKICNISDKKSFNASFIPLDRNNILSLEGFQYNLSEKMIKRGDTTTISNIIIENEAFVNVKEGAFIAIVSRNLNESN